MKNKDHSRSLHEQINFFRNNETDADAHGVVASPRSKETINRNIQKEREKMAGEIGSPDELCNIIINTVTELNNLELADQYKTDSKQQALLLKKISQAKKLIEDTGSLVIRYVQSIENWQAVKNEEDKQHKEKYLQEFTDTDIARKNSHDALISQLSATIRFLNFNFSQDVSEGTLEEWQDNQLEKGQEVLQAKRMHFKHKNVILPDIINLKNRKHITAWAELISQSFTKIEKLLSEKPESSISN